MSILSPSIRANLLAMLLLGINAANLAAAADELPIIRSAQSGPWSQASTWEGGKVPGNLARVQIRTGHAVTYDVASDDVIRALNIAGTLTFARDRNTVLNVGLIRIEANDAFSEQGFDCDSHPDENHTGPRPTLEVGSAQQPIPAEYSAKIRLHYVEGLDKQSCPSMVCCGGRMDFHGAPLSRAWVKLETTADKGADSLVLAEAVSGWRAGDRIIITATQNPDDTNGPTTEERSIKAIDGTNITLDAPLEFKHTALGRLRGEVANLSRNVIVESANPAGERGHTMYHRGSAGSISYAEFRHLGKKNVLGRYSIHFHQIGNTMRGSYVVGASIHDSHNRWLTIHGTNYLLVRDNVGYKSIGHGFFLEDGTEVFNILDRNLAVQALQGKRLPKQVLPFDANEGAGFWWANSLNTFTRNVSCENERYGYRFEATRSSSFDIKSPVVMKPDGTYAKTDIRTLPFVRFEGNEAHCDGLYGVNLGEGVDRVGPDTSHPFILRDTLVWELHYAFRPQATNVLCENMHIEDTVYGVYHPNYDHYVFRNLKIYNVAAEPFNRGHDDLSAQYGPLTVDGLEFTSKYWGDGMPFIQISDDNPSGNGVSHFRNVKVLNRPANGRRALVNLGGGPRPMPKTEHGVPIYLHDYYSPGKHAKVVSTKAKDLLNDGNNYRSEPPLTGDESRVAEVSDVEFPELLKPVDDLPPVTVVTHVEKRDGKLRVRGIVTDNGEVKRVVVNSAAAKVDPKTGDWEAELPSTDNNIGRLSVRSEDAAGNVERLPHVIMVD